MEEPVMKVEVQEQEVELQKQKVDFYSASVLTGDATAEDLATIKRHTSV